MNYKNKMNMTSEVIALLMNCASHHTFKCDETLASKEDMNALKLLKEIQDACWSHAKNKDKIRQYFFDYGDTNHCLAAVLCGIDKSTTLSFSKIEKKYSQLDLEDRLSFLQGGKGSMQKYMELLDAAELNDSEKYFHIHALLEPEVHKDIIFEILNEMENALNAYKDVLCDLYAQQKKKLGSINIKQCLQQHTAFEFQNVLDETMKEEAQIVLFDPFTLKITNEKKDSNHCLIGAYVYLENSGTKSSLKENVLAYTKIFSDESKLNILKLLSKKKMMNREIAKETGLTTATISHHMSVLTDSQLVKATVSSNKVIYELNKQKLDEILEQINTYFHEFS